MKIPFRKASTLSKAEGSKLGWRERLAALKGKSKAHQSTAKLEIDDANGETLIFPEIGDVSEIAEGVAVTATDGTHIFTADTTTYTVEVLAGVITTVTEAPTAAAPEAMSAETVEFIEAVAVELEANEAFRTTAQATIDKLTTDLATATADFAAFKATMKHGGDGTDDKGAADKGVTIGGKKIDLTKLNLK